jgi:hypothetical protein
LHGKVTNYFRKTEIYCVMRGNAIHARARDNVSMVRLFIREVCYRHDRCWTNVFNNGNYSQRVNYINMGMANHWAKEERVIRSPNDNLASERP